MSRAVLSLGSNLGDPAAQLDAAVASFGSAVVAASSLYRTPPWGPVTQDDFLNQTIVVDDDAVDASGWLHACRRAETAAHRERATRWGPRTLDADVIAVWEGDIPVVSDNLELILPHPHAASRGFVLLPWAEIDPGAVLPGIGPIADLLRDVDVADISVHRQGALRGR